MSSHILNKSNLQVISNLLAETVAAVYGAYDVVQDDQGWVDKNPSPATVQKAIQEISKRVSGYANIVPIWIWEAHPNVMPTSSLTPSGAIKAISVGGLLPQKNTEPAGYVYGYQLFGFAASSTDPSNPYNVLSLRGTVTNQEALSIVEDYKFEYTSNDIQLPILDNYTHPKVDCGLVNRARWEWYTFSNPTGWAYSLAHYVREAFNRVEKVSPSGPNHPWYVTAHSLGGAFATLGALDLVLERQQTGGPPLNMALVTFASMVVGDQKFMNTFNKTQLAGNTFRYANLCDFVPSLRGILPGETVGHPYFHVGTGMLFSWQTDDDWANHNLQHVYMPMVASMNYFNLIYQGTPKYPVGI